jgi:hypothetical protein
MIQRHAMAARRVAAMVTTLSLAFVGTALIFLGIEAVRIWMPFGDPGVAQTVIAVAIFALSFPIVGWVILRRDPTNRLGWIYLAIGFWQALNMFASTYSTLAYWVASGDLPFASELSWVAVWAWIPGFTLFSTVGILLFPTGRLPSRRWWPVLALTAVSFVLLLAPVVASWPYRGLPLERLNALNLTPPADPALEAASAVAGVGQIVLLAAMLGSVAGLAVRFRRSTGVERLQLKWFTYAAILDLLLLMVWTAGVLGTVAGALSAVLLASLPIAIAIAIGRHHLYDIDRVISRTIGYAIVTGVLGGTFVGIVLLSQAVVDSLVPQVRETGTPAVAASTLVVAALFQPVRRRVQATVDRHFDRTRVDRDRSILGLGYRLGDALELEAIRADLLGTIDATVRPASIAIWLRRN